MGCGLIVFPMTDRFISKHRLGQNKRKQAQQENDKMKNTINEYDFVRAFDEMNRSENFSRAGRFALYDYLTEYEEDTGVEIDLDVIALCCDFTEYESLDEFREDYGLQRLPKLDMDDVMDMTHVIAHYDGDRFIAQDF